MMDFVVIAAVIVAALILIVSGFSARLIVRPGRTRVWSTPKEVGLAYEDIAFQAQDGVRLVGWFIPAPGKVARPAPLVMVLHGWPWCRMGTRANNVFSDLPGSKPVNLLPFMRQLHDAGYHILAYDHRNFGDSESRGVVTGGWLESRDVLGALDFLSERHDVDGARIGAIGFSQGGATLMFASSQDHRIRAAIAVQPVTPDLFARRYGRALMGPLAFVVHPVSQIMFRLAGGPSLSSIEPAMAVAGARAPFLFVQGTGDRWGSQADVARMAAMAPHASTLFPETRHRFEGYTYVVNNPSFAMDFFRTHLALPVSSPTQGVPSARQDVAGSASRGINA